MKELGQQKLVIITKLGPPRAKAAVWSSPLVYICTAYIRLQAFLELLELSPTALPRNFSSIWKAEMILRKKTRRFCPAYKLNVLRIIPVKNSTKKLEYFK